MRECVRASFKRNFLKPGQKVSKKRLPPPLQALGFMLNELKEARLAPIVSFKGLGAKGGAESNLD